MVDQLLSTRANFAFWGNLSRKGAGRRRKVNGRLSDHSSQGRFLLGRRGKESSSSLPAPALGSRVILSGVSTQRPRASRRQS